MSINKNVVKEITTFRLVKNYAVVKTIDEELQDILIKNETKQGLDNAFSIRVLNLYIFHKYMFAYAHDILTSSSPPRTCHAPNSACEHKR